MSKRGGARSALTSRYSVVFIALSLAGGIANASEDEGRLKWEAERILIVGIPSFEVTEWAGFLERKRIAYRYDRGTHTMYVYEDPLPILAEASGKKEIAQTVKRGFLERKLERQVRGELPGVIDPRVCLAFPSAALLPIEEDSEPVAMVLAGGLRAGEREQLKYLVADEVEGLPARNVIVMSGHWRPWPAYGGEMEMRTPHKSVAVTQTARAEP